MALAGACSRNLLHKIKFMVGSRDEINATATPNGDEGPAVALTFLNEWLVESVGRWNGIYTVIGQVEAVLPEGESWQVLRFIEDAPLTPLEKTTLLGAIEPFRGAISNFGIDLDESPTELSGPALVAWSPAGWWSFGPAAS